MFASLRFLLLVSTFVTSISLGAPLDVKQSGDVGKDKPTAPEEKGGKGGYEPPPPVVTEHTLTLPDVYKLNPLLADELGLELVPTNMPIEMLVVEKSN